jgi:hypothetical protein
MGPGHQQAIHGIPDPHSELKESLPGTGRLVALRVLGGVEHDYRLAAWIQSFKTVLFALEAAVIAGKS